MSESPLRAIPERRGCEYVSIRPVPGGARYSARIAYSFFFASAMTSTARRRCSSVPVIMTCRSAFIAPNAASLMSCQFSTGLVTDVLPRSGPGLLGLGPAGIGEREPLPAAGLLADDESFVLEQLQGRVDRPGAWPPDASGAGLQLSDHFVAVHRSLQEQGEHGRLGRSVVAPCRGPGQTGDRRGHPARPTVAGTASARQSHASAPRSVGRPRSDARVSCARA